MTASQDFHLVLIHPAEEIDAPIVCSLLEIASGEEVSISFNVLSYVVQDRSPMRQIFLDESVVEVSESLYEALCHLRAINDGVFLWVDPICTNGSEPLEPTNAMHEMIDIHRMAEQVIVWLGKITSHSISGLSTVGMVVSGCQNEEYPKRLIFLQGLLGNPLFANGLACSQPLFNYKWWHWDRIGTLIELGIDSKTVFQCSEASMEWDIFSEFILTLRFVLPRLQTKYNSWLEQAILQIPGTIPEAFREVFSSKLKEKERSDKPEWGVGPLFSHPGDILYRLKNTSEGQKVGRVLSGHSVRLCNRFRSRCNRKLLQDLQGETDLANIRKGLELLSSDSDADEASDGSLSVWLNLLTQRAMFKKDSQSCNVLQKAASKMNSRIADPDTTSNSQDAHSAYIYSPISSSLGETRILILYPSHDTTADVECDLFRFEGRYYLETGVESLPYMALSYVWGDPNPPKSIYLGGKEKQITRNLHEALLGLRDTYTPVLLWADALCIDQSNIAEKTEQVAMMDDIYKNAGCVLIWLDNDVVPVANEVEVHGLADTRLTTMSFFQLLEKYLFHPWYDPGYFTLDEQPIFAELVHNMTGFLFFNALKRLFRRRYWSRVWTMQELLLGNNLILCDGGYAVYFQVVEFMFVKIWNKLLPQDSMNAVDYIDDTSTENLLNLYWEIVNGRKPSIFRTLLMSRERNATVKEDYVYGTLGLLKHQGSWLVPDYSSEFMSTNLKVFKKILEDDQNLDVLSACELRNHYEEDPVRVSESNSIWPSWLPDWSITPQHRRRARSVLFAQDNSQRTAFRAAGQSQSVMRLLNDETLLCIQGATVDTIELVDSSEWAAYKKAHYWSLFTKEARTRNAYGSLENRAKALRNTITLGQDTLIDFFELEEAESEEIPDHCRSSTPLDADEDKPELHEDRDPTRNRTQLLNGLKCPDYPSRFFVTARGYIGRGPIAIQKDDPVVIFLGSKVPHALRATAPGRFRLLGECYVHGVMRGAFMNSPDFEIRDYVLQ